MGLERFTRYTETDPGSEVTITVDQITFVGVTRNDPPTLVYDDKGAAHFDGDFTHLVEMYIDSDSTSGGNACGWALANEVGGWYDIYSDIAEDQDMVSVNMYKSAIDVWRVTLYLVEDGGLSVDEWLGAAVDTQYYITIDRDYDGGANNTGRYTVYIRTGSHTGNLEDTITLDCASGEQNDFRYIYGCMNLNSAGGGTVVGTVKNLDLQEVSDNIAKIGGVTWSTVAKVVGVAAFDIKKITGVLKEI